MNIQKKNRFIFLATIALLFMGCASLYKSKSIFTGNMITPGISKAEFISQYGKPYKESFFHDDNKVLQEDIYYKEELYIKGWYIINTVFHFENSRLVSQKQEKEERLYKNNACSCP